MSSSERCYRIELWVGCSLRSHDIKPFRFSLQEADVELRLPGKEDRKDGFVAAVELARSRLSDAERDAHDLLVQVLNLISLEFKMPALVENAVRSQIKESGEIRHCAIYSSEWRPRSLFLMQQKADEIQSFLKIDPAQEVQDALYWLRWSYQVAWVPDAFLFVWMALERLVGDEDRDAVCGKCRNQVVCPKHGVHKYRGVSSSKIKDLLVRYKVGNPAAILNLRHRLVHGGLKFNFETRVRMGYAVKHLWKTVEGELERRLGTRTVIRTPGGGRVRCLPLSFDCEYRTSYPSAPFPPDCPSYDDVADYTEMDRKGREYSKIVNIVRGQANW